MFLRFGSRLESPSGPDLGRTRSVGRVKRTEDAALRAANSWLLHTKTGPMQQCKCASHLPDEANST